MPLDAPPSSTAVSGLTPWCLLLCLQELARARTVVGVMKEPLETVTGAGHRLGEYIRDQRRGSQISLRQLSALAGVSNPYLSQIERGLRRPSAEILSQIAKALRISAEALYVQAGFLEHREGDGAVADAVLADPGLNERQKQVLLEIYDSFRKENALPAPEATAREKAAAEQAAPKATAPKRTARKKTAPEKTAAQQAAPRKTSRTTPDSSQEDSA